MTGHRSVFNSQILSMKKSEMLNVKFGEDMDHTEIDLSTQNKKRFIELQRKILSKNKDRRKGRIKSDIDKINSDKKE